MVGLDTSLPLDPAFREVYEALLDVAWEGSVSLKVDSSWTWPARKFSAKGVAKVVAWQPGGSKTSVLRGV